MNLQNYEKQLRWREYVASKIEHQRDELTVEDADASFTPTFFTQSAAKHESALGVTKKSGQTHIDRQIKARKEKEEQLSKQVWKQKKSLSMSKSSIGAPPNLENSKPSVEDAEFQSYLLSLVSDAGALSASAGSASLLGGADGDNSEGDSDEEAIVEILERERREWHKERLALIQCIKMQQLNLAQSSAAREQAMTIAKDFAKAIEGFEDRLTAAESNVQRELTAVKVIADSLVAAADSLRASATTLSAAGQPSSTPGGVTARK